MSSHRSSSPPWLDQGGSSTAGQSLVHESPLFAHESPLARDLRPSSPGPSKQVVLHSSPTHLRKRPMGDMADVKLKRQKEIFAGPMAEVIQQSEDMIRAELEQHFKSQLATLKSTMKASLDAMCEDYRSELGWYQAELKKAQDAHQQAIASSDSKGKKRAGTPSGTPQDDVWSHRTKPTSQGTEPRSIKDILANLRKQRNRSGTPVLVTRRNDSDIDESDETKSSEYGTPNDSGEESPTRQPSRRQRPDDITTLLRQALDIVDGTNASRPGLSSPAHHSRPGSSSPAHHHTPRSPAHNRRRGRKSNVDDEVKAIKETEDKSDRRTLLEICRKVFKDEFAVDCDDAFIGKASAEVRDVQSFEMYGTSEPKEGNLVFDFSRGPESKWNDAIITILVSKIKDVCNRSIEYPRKPEAYLVDLVQERYKRVRNAWKKGRPQKTEGVAESPEALENRLVRGKDLQLQTARRRERRVSKFKRRVEIVRQTIDCKEQEGAADTRLWKWLKKVLDRLGQDGMSSDESDHDDDAIETTYRPKRMIWRRNIDYELELIDDEYRRLARSQVRRGAKLITRERRRGIASTRSPVTQLPMSFYEESWLTSQTDYYIRKTLKMSTEDFKWKNLLIS